MTIYGEENQEIEGDLDHQRKLLHTLRGRLREREIQEVRFGINVPPEITEDIRMLRERIAGTEREIARLRTLLAQDQISIVEVEFRALLADVLKDGMPDIYGTYKLELTRLRLGITRESAIQIERDVRNSLAIENFLKCQG